MCDICEPTGKTWRKICEGKGKIRMISIVPVLTFRGATWSRTLGSESASKQWYIPC